MDCNCDLTVQFSSGCSTFVKMGLVVAGCSLMGYTDQVPGVLDTCLGLDADFTSFSMNFVHPYLGSSYRHLCIHRYDSYHLKILLMGSHLNLYVLAIPIFYEDLLSGCI